MSDKMKFLILCICGGVLSVVSTIELFRHADTTPLSSTTSLFAAVCLGFCARYGLKMIKNSKRI
ncbi:MAG: hypothetical protein KJ871_15395 [Alphaproteobacteria bacterium]|uniref:hypothetical protein n=1 Tax=Hyphomonas sp. TaxID=87 RepID=UPI001D450122|nr:hypothetical protein [Alphaproteobacteria bacterium]MBU2084055.1 hypothetical protein [Alphaproteobacteria bacterium]MBU2144410.1 hypothetical protein [Alphaproteobacteria bacterium]MBU2196332.1 hypothetical protein [Alphaproteobacteria bacterium]